MAQPADDRFLAVLAGGLAVMVTASAIGCHYPGDWLLENALVVVAFIYLAATRRVLPMTRPSYLLILAFFGLHEIGAHWTFAEVPYNAWWQALFGTTLNEVFGWERNHYDRLVHFSFGFLLGRPWRETLAHGFHRSGFWHYALPCVFVLAMSGAYELIEWAAAIVFGGDLGQAYLGTQGDVWDSHRDSALATAGAIVAMAGSAAWHRWHRPAPA